MEATSHYEQERRQKLAKLRELGIEPYGQRTAGIQSLAAIKALYKPEMGHDGGPEAIGAGRVMLKRDMGKLSFLTLRDESGDLQVALDKKRLSERDWQVRDLIDLGDLLVVGGKLGQTNKGETTIWADSVSMAAKALLPPPAKWEGLSDVELRYRQRYVDLWANPRVMRILKLRMRVVDEIRRFLAGRGFVEVETPMMQTLAGGAAAKPFVTHHNALDIPLYMRIAPELYLKRLLVGGFSKVFELNRNFRNEGISPRHNPEFTMLEVYEAFGSWETMADLVEEMITTVAQNVFGTLLIEHPNGRKINLQRPWRRVSMADLVERAIGWRFDKRCIQEDPAAFKSFLDYEEEGYSRVLDAKGSKSGEPSGRPYESAKKWRELKETQVNSTPEAAEQLVYVYESVVESTLIDPCFVTHIPSVIIPLARENKDDPYFADVYELAINGVEISPGYTELNDPEIQAKHFAHQVGDKDQQQKMDEDFLNALRYGMPPAGGLGLGIDRLVMMLTCAESIRDVILFPLMKPQEK
ncbi:MAG: lysine--tRNA ligase [Tepidisphaeraceae bacterium]|jgi:lysyl-tRNA synthetase class 2